MTQANPMAAQLLSVSSAAYGAYATNRLFERCPEAKDRFGEMAFTYWKDHFGQRIKELSAAVLVGEVGLFNSHVSWAKAAFEAREIQNDLIRESLHALKDVLGEELPEMCRQTPIQFIEIAKLDKYMRTNNTFGHRANKSAAACLSSSDESGLSSDGDSENDDYPDWRLMLKHVEGNQNIFKKTEL